MKKAMIMIGIVVLFACISLSGAQANLAAESINKIILQPDSKQYWVNAEEFAMSVPPFKSDGRIFVPLDFLGSVLGTDDNQTSWRVSSGEVDLLVPTPEGGFVEMKMQNASHQLALIYLHNEMEKPGMDAGYSKIITMDVTPLIREGQIYLPLRWVAEACGFKVTWDNSAQRALLISPGSGDQEWENSIIREGETGGGLAGEVKINSRGVKNSSTQMEVDLQIPFITGLGDRALQEQINKEIMEKAQKTRAELEKDYAELAESAKASGFPVHTFQFFVRHKTSTCGGIVSLAVESYRYSGGAHGLTTVDFYNLDTKNNKLLTLSSLFKDDADYVSLINEEIIKQIAAQQKGEQIPYFEGENGFQSINAEHSFYLKDNELIIHFGQYEIAPYAAGMPEFSIPLDLLKEHLSRLAGTTENVPAALGTVAVHSPEEQTKNDFYASIHYLPENDLLSFTIPEKIPDGYKFYLHVSGRLLMEGSLSGMSFHAFDRESEGSSWISGRTYTYPLKSASLDECLLVFGLVGKNGQELLSTVYVYPDGTKRIKDRAAIIFPAYKEDNSGNLPNSKDINDSPSFMVQMELPEDWMINDTRIIDEIPIPGDFHTLLYIYEKGKPIGYLGFNKFEPYTEEIPREQYYKTVYTSLRLSSSFHWDPYTAIKTTATSETGIVNIWYLDPNEIDKHPGAMPDVPQLETIGILSYDKELEVFVGLAFMPDTVDYAQAKTIAQSISLSAIEPV
ncbi:MAG: stalk domain-containing protein [Dethiobacteria bacterium]